MKNIKKLLLITIILFMNFGLILNVNANSEGEPKEYLNTNIGSHWSNSLHGYLETNAGMDLYAVVELIFNDTSNSIFEFTEEEITKSYDISRNNDGSVMAYLIDNILCIEFNGKLMLNENSINFFSGFENLTSIRGMENIDTSEVVNMQSMFAGVKIESIDLSNFNTSKVTSMKNMFNSSGFTSLDLSSFDTTNVTDMSGMFSGSQLLVELDLSNFDTANVTDMSSIFSNSGLKKINVSSFNTKNVTNMSEMFYSCYSLKSIDLSNFNTSKVVNMNKMFSYCVNLTELDVSSFDTQRVNDMSSMFSGCLSLVELDLSAFDTSNVTNISAMFDGCSSLQKLNLSSFDTSKVTDMGFMFRNTGLTSIDLSNFDTSSVTSMYEMFSDCKFETIDLSNFNTSNVTIMTSMFHGCEYLKEIDLSGFDTAKVTNISSMFYNCKSLEKIDLSTFDTTSLEDISGLFYGCVSLQDIKFGNFDTSKVTYMGYMFKDCQSLEKLDLSSFDTGNVTDMKYMFYNCIKLKELNLSNFDTSKVTDMDHMFRNCENLKILDLSSFDTSNVKNMSFMLAEMYNLKTVYVSDKWSTAKVMEYDALFHNNYNLLGQNGTRYSYGVDYREYARLDLVDNPGLFSRKLTLKSEKYDLSKDYIYLGKDELDLNSITKTNEESIVEEDNKLNVYYNEELTKRYDLIKVLSSDYDLSKEYIYLGDKDLNSTDITIINGYNIIDNNQLKIYSSYNGDLLASYNLINLYSDKYDLNKKVLNVGNDDYLSHIEAVNAEIKQEGNKLNIYFGKQLVDSYTLLTIYSDTYDLTKDYIYTELEGFDISKINIGNEELIVEDNKLKVYYQDDLIKSYDLVSISSEKYQTLKDKYIFVGLGTSGGISIDVINGTQRLENNNLNIYYNDTLVDTIKIVSYKSDYYDLTKEYIDVGTGSIDLSKISVINGNVGYSSETNSFVITYSPRPGMGIILAEYPVIKYSSDYYDFSKDYIDIGTFKLEDVNVILQPKLINVTSSLENNQFNLYYGYELIKSFDLVSIITNTFSAEMNNYFYIAPSKNEPTIEVINGRYEIIDNVMNVYYKDNLLKSLKLAWISSDYYDLTNDDIVLVNESIDLSKINTFNCSLRIDEVTKNIDVVIYWDNEQSTWNYLDGYHYVSVSSDYYDLNQDYFYIGANDIDLTKINVEGGSFIVSGSSELELQIGGRFIKSYKLIKLWGHGYDLTNEFIFVRGEQFDANKIEVSWGKALLEDDKLNIYYEDELLDSFDIVQVSSDKYDLTSYYVYTGTEQLDLSSITVTNGTLKVENDRLNIYYNNRLLNWYYITKIYSDEYDLTKDYIFVGTDIFNGSNISVTNGAAMIKNNQLDIRNGNYETVKTLEIIRLYSVKYDLTKDYIYIGTGELQLSSITAGAANLLVENNKLNVYYKDDLLRSYDLIYNTSTKYDLSREYIYLGLNKIDMSALSIINGRFKVEGNNLNVYYGEDVVYSYKLTTYSSGTYDLSKGYVFVGNKDFDPTTINVINGYVSFISDASFFYIVTNDSHQYESIDIIKVASQYEECVVTDDSIYIQSPNPGTSYISVTNADVIEDESARKFKIKYNDEIIFEYDVEAEIREIFIDNLTFSCDTEKNYYEFRKGQIEPKALEVRFYPSKYIKDKTLSWTSSDPSIATVDSNGVVTPIRPGSVTITVTSSNGKTRQADIVIYGGIIEYSSSSYTGIYTGKNKTIKLDIKTPEAQAVYSLDGINYTLNELPTFTEVGEHRVYYKITYAYDTAYGDQMVKIYDINQIDNNLKFKNNILTVKYFNQTFLDIKVKMQIISSIAHEFAHYDNTLNYIEDDILKTGDYLKIRVNEEDEIHQYQFALLGDLNGDGEIDSLDLATMMNHISGKKELTDVYLETAYLNNDEEIDSLDLAYLMNHIAGKEGY